MEGEKMAVIRMIQALGDTDKDRVILFLSQLDRTDRQFGAEPRAEDRTSPSHPADK